ncbi:hypothetical protein [Robertmurraya siralis]|uniref:hypothetical protein n=1 Tax=Robertmurraya siralis TaxID=77777 RepID=UPI0010F579D3|nr:hypothetical protein [Robertmurraya siralis]
MKKNSQQTLESIYVEVLENASVDDNCVFCWKEQNNCGCNSHGYVESDVFINLDEEIEYMG